MSGVLTYNPKNLLIIFGAEQIHGFSEDDVITIAPNGDGTQIYVGADGEVGNRATGAGLLPLLIKDLSGQTLFSAEQAWVANMPEASYGRSIDSREWTLYTGQVTAPIIGGNN